MKKNFFCNKTELLNFIVYSIIKALDKLYMISVRLGLNGLNFAVILQSISSYYFFLLSNISELSICAKTKNF